MNNLKVEYLNFAERPITAIELMKLYKDAGWGKERGEQDIEKMLKSVISIGAWKDGTLIGFARAISDGKFRPYVEDLVIDNAFQNSGIGTNLVSKLLEELSDIAVISLFCEEHLIPFYTKNQFKLSKSQFVMHRK